ncbi:MAG: AfsR/SARP family transcriptional regulator [Dehalococcoidia bacterium]
MVCVPTVELPAPPATPVLCIDLLGSPEVTWAGRPLALPRRQLRALLYRLAATSQPVPREQLCFLFWPDIPEAAARRNLIVLLNHLRRALPRPDVLLTSGDTVGLDRDAARSDAVLAAAALAVARRPPRLSLLREAVDLYRGPFLDGFSLSAADEFEAWVAREREAWERRYLEALAALIEAQTARGDYAAAIETARRYLAADELAEEVHRRLIALYAVTGDRTAALQQFARCAEVLDRELGVPPHPKTRALYEAVREGRTSPAERPHGETAEFGAQPAARASRDDVIAPAVRSAPASMLPAPATPLIGRAGELATARTLLEGGDVRLLTLCGMGGSGKTRLALEIGWELRERFAHGTVFVPLALLRDPTLVIGAIAKACGMQEFGAAAPEDDLSAHLRDKELLLVLDNCEHLPAAAPAIGRLLAAARNLRILATSRTLLNLSGEHALPVPPLAVPSPAAPDPELFQEPSWFLEFTAVQLFVARAQSVLPSFALTEENAEVVATICARLDGLPLAIELAAARLKLLSPRALLGRLDRRLGLLSGGPSDLPLRQQTLRATIEWSYRLLDAARQGLFERLAIFAGGWTLEAAEAVCHEVDMPPGAVLDGLQSLVDAHLVTRATGTDGEPRFGMLETVREYALERLETSGAAEDAVQAHVRHFAGMAERAAVPASPAEMGRSFRRLDEDHTNLLVAIDRSLDDGDIETALRLVSALGRFWFLRGYFREGRARLERALAAGDEAKDASDWIALRARACAELGEIAMVQIDRATGCRYLGAAVDLWRTLDRPGELATALVTWSAALYLTADDTAAEAALQEGEALAVATGEPMAQAMAAMAHSYGTFRAGRFAEARDWLQSAIVLARGSEDPIRLLQFLVDLTGVTLRLDDTAATHTAATEALELARGLGSRLVMALAMNQLGETARCRADYRTAGEHYAESLRLLRELGDRQDVPRLLRNLGYVALHEGDAVRAAALFRESLEQLHDERTERGIADCLVALACLAAVQNRPLGAARLWGTAEALHEAGSWRIWPADKVECDRYLPLASAAAAPAAFAVAWQEGRTLTVPQALGVQRPEGATGVV